MPHPTSAAPSNGLTDFITIKEAGALLGLSAVTIRRYVADGRLTAYRLGPRALRLDRADVEALLTAVPTASVA